MTFQLSQKNSSLGELSQVQRNRVPISFGPEMERACTASLVRVLEMAKV